LNVNISETTNFVCTLLQVQEKKALYEKSFHATKNSYPFPGKETYCTNDAML